MGIATDSDATAGMFTASTNGVQAVSHELFAANRADCNDGYRFVIAKAVRASAITVGSLMPARHPHPAEPKPKPEPDPPPAPDPSPDPRPTDPIPPPAPASEPRRGELPITKSRLHADAPAACAQLSGLRRDAGRALWSARPFEPRPGVLMRIVAARRSWPDVKAPYGTPHLGSHASRHG